MPEPIIESAPGYSIPPDENTVITEDMITEEEFEAWIEKMAEEQMLAEQKTDEVETPASTTKEESNFFFTMMKQEVGSAVTLLMRQGISTLLLGGGAFVVGNVITYMRQPLMIRGEASSNNIQTMPVGSQIQLQKPQFIIQSGELH